MRPGQFNVYQFFANDTCELVHYGVDAKTAVEGAAQLARSVGGRIGTTRRVIITDYDDFCCFEWQYGKGITFPPSLSSG